MEGRTRLLHADWVRTMTTAGRGFWACLSSTRVIARPVVDGNEKPTRRCVPPGRSAGFLHLAMSKASRPGQMPPMAMLATRTKILAHVPSAPRRNRCRPVGWSTTPPLYGSGAIAGPATVGGP